MVGLSSNYACCYSIGRLTGNSVTIISIARLGTLFTTNFETDITWNYTRLAVWSDAEPPVGLISCCLPAYGPYFRRVRRLFHQDSGEIESSDRSSPNSQGFHTLHPARASQLITDMKKGQILRSITYDVESHSTRNFRDGMTEHGFEMH